MLKFPESWLMQNGATLGANVPHPTRNPCQGFTLIELMVGLVLVSILMGIGLPMFRSFILDQQLRATTSELRVALTLARSEAVKRNRAVALQPFDADDGWDSGWTIPSPVPGDPDLLAHRQGGDVTITTDPDMTSLQFTPMGRAASVVEFEVDIGPPESSIQSCMQLALDGRVTSTKGACSGG
jgi:type IV fimbrial biogenesis protein FimT